MKKKKLCIKKTKTGNRCPFVALPDSKDGSYCFNHDPDRKAERIEARKKGGKTRAANRRNMFNVYDVIALINETINMVLSGKMATKDAQTIATLSNTFLAALKIAPANKRGKTVNGQKVAKKATIRKIRELYGMSTDEDKGDESN